MENQNNVVNETVEAQVEGGAAEVDTVEVKEEKTFTQAELDKILNKKFAQWQKKTEEAKAASSRTKQKRSGEYYEKENGSSISGRYPDIILFTDRMRKQHGR